MKSRFPSETVGHGILADPARGLPAADVSILFGCFDGKNIHVEVGNIRTRDMDTTTDKSLMFDGDTIVVDLNKDGRVVGVEVLRSIQMREANEYMAWTGTLEDKERLFAVLALKVVLSDWKLADSIISATFERLKEPMDLGQIVGSAVHAAPCGEEWTPALC